MLHYTRRGGAPSSTARKKSPFSRPMPPRPPRPRRRKPAHPRTATAARPQQPLAALPAQTLPFPCKSSPRLRSKKGLPRKSSPSSPQQKRTAAHKRGGPFLSHVREGVRLICRTSPPASAGARSGPWPRPRCAGTARPRARGTRGSDGSSGPRSSGTPDSRRREPWNPA